MHILRPALAAAVCRAATTVPACTTGRPAGAYLGWCAHYCLLLVLLQLRLPQVPCPHEAEFLSYYLLLSCSTFGSFRASTANMVRLLNQMGRGVLVSPGGGVEGAAETSGLWVALGCSAGSRGCWSSCA
jgi:hypothetical protein